MKALWHNRALVWKLAKNDFKKRYAGSYMGAFWALAQPVITVALYYFVFEFVFHSRAMLVAGGVQAPYVLWLTAGLVPWFYFSEGLQQGMQAFLEYNYLVKKVVFEIRVLPAVKVIGASFVHIFFVAVLLLIQLIYRQPVRLSILQLPYYSLCMACLLMALSYTSSAVVVFFRDLTQIVNILLQVLMWATPILWDLSQLGGAPGALRMAFMLNPVYYIVDGYRGALLEGRWLWERPWLSLYFWGITALLYAFGRWVFLRLKPHFADVL